MSDAVPLKEHLELAISSLDRHYEAQVAAMKEAVETAAKQLDTRLEGMNRFRDELRDRAAAFASKSEVTAELTNLKLLIAQLQAKATERDKEDVASKRLIEKVNDLDIWRGNIQGRVAVVSVVLSAGVSLAFLLLNYFLNNPPRH